ncbi:hypothetical protein GQ43DRAFT_418821 [Delitschia confertaspora ATCC 74209]|uniref:Uncharacterized protein n=1 Tax=Delitschia confertaspora ATCC 74209 TaxID=1513339 RepID=A0A9P4JP66_9PLEO|nr:hypothetical protein GQ43DRAFT_418821 [Delitschia confertaspora ATCC 74209]
MFHNNTQSLVHLPGKPAHDNEALLPRGECGFILKESESKSGSRQRCTCRSFFADSMVRSLCGCGHQAWHHESQPVSAVPVQEHIAVIEEVKRLKQEVQRFQYVEHDLKQELFKERLVREEREKTFKQVEELLYQNMRWLKVHMDDKVEAVVDKTQDFENQIKAVQEKLTVVDEATMELEDRIDRVEQNRGFPSKTSTPKASTPKVTPIPQLPPTQTIAQLPIRTEKKDPLTWNARVIFVPRKAQLFAYDPDSAGYRRCATRNLQQNLDFNRPDSAYFVKTIEVCFKGILRGRPWMPMVGHRPPDEPFGRMALRVLPQNLCAREVWDYSFLEDHCIAHDKMQGDVLYICLQYEDVTWNEIRFLPPVLGAEESCWQHDEELDGTAKFKSLDSELMYDYQDPPPYSSRTHSIMDRTPSKLDVLADSASMLSRADSASLLSPTDARSTLSRVHTAYSERASLRSFETIEETDDEHRDKKPKLRTKQSLPNIAHSPGGSLAAPMYVSGRSKRKMPVREKGPKEPLHFNIGGISKFRSNLLHPHSSKGKETADGAQ